MKHYLYIKNILEEEQDHLIKFEYCDTNNSKISKWIEIFFYQNIGVDEESIKKIVELIWDDYNLSNIHSLLDFLENNMGKDISLYTE